MPSNLPKKEQLVSTGVINIWSRSGKYLSEVFLVNGFVSGHTHGDGSIRIIPYFGRMNTCLQNYFGVHEGASFDTYTYGERVVVDCVSN